MVAQLRVAVLNGLEPVPWVPLIAGLVEGFRELGADVRPIRVCDLPEFFLNELDEFAPDLALLPFCRWEWLKRKPYFEVLKAMGTKTAAVLWDDPYDMETGLWLAEEVDAVFTPEELAIDIYNRTLPAFHVPPFVSRRMHHPPEKPCPKVIDVFMVGGVNRKPRLQILPHIRNLCTRLKKNYTEVAGVTRWLVGRQLTNYLHQSRIVLEIPRSDVAHRTNPHQIPCTWTGPRVYIAAECEAFVLAIGPRPDFKELFPFYPAVGDINEALAFLPELLGELDLGRVARMQHGFTHRISPGWYALEMLTHLVDAGLFDARAQELSEALLSRTDRQDSRGSTSRPGAAIGVEPASQP